MGPDGAVKIVFRKEINAAKDPGAVTEEYMRKYREEISNPYLAASRGYIDDIIPPTESRMRLIAALESLREKRQDTPRRKHGNIPL
jgi:acetyl-CoA carboxylase carboxyltransferase component